MEDTDKSESCHGYSEPVVKITVSPNTPSPEPTEEDLSESDQTRQDSNPEDTTFSSEDCTVGMEQTKPDCYFPDVPTCIDFGIQDYLCRVQHETEFDLSSDTDTSYLGATPPHRFSDGEIDPIEAMPVLLDTQLNVRDDSLTSLGTDKEVFSSAFCSWKDPGVQRFLAKSVSKESLLLRFNSGQSNNYKFKALQIQERHLPRPFKRNISLPATIFKAVLAEHAMLGISPSNNNLLDTTASSDDITGVANVKVGQPRLSKIDSISNSSQNDVLSFENSQKCISSTPSTEMINQDNFGSTWNISADSEPEDGENQPFTSEVEKRSLMIRHMRRLIRQDTTGNFAPPDYHI
ncbi:unnamed protein product [Allacma fusca]|uniref:Uncharacterized protein n=1 Tax=Allacma fusca TaxID=39272 RepID=A0A8J2LSC6_9HEXA|nr:unnamed protein product [Allacma fusca]